MNLSHAPSVSRIPIMTDLFHLTYPGSDKALFVEQLSTYLQERFFRQPFGMKPYVERLVTKLSTTIIQGDLQKTEDTEQAKTFIRQHLIYMRLLQERIASHIGAIISEDLPDDWYHRMERLANMDIPELHDGHDSLEQILDEGTPITDGFKKEYAELSELLQVAENRFGSLMVLDETTKRFGEILDQE